MWRSSLSIVATSCSCGTLASVTGSAHSSAAVSSGSAAFLAPAIGTSPCKAAATADQKFVHVASGAGRGTRCGVTAGRAPLPATPTAARRTRAAGVGQWWWVRRLGVSRAAGVPFGGGQRLHRKRVDLFAHSIAERRVDALVARDARAALELGRHDGGEEVAAVAFDLEVLAGQARRQ